MSFHRSYLVLILMMACSSSHRESAPGAAAGAKSERSADAGASVDAGAADEPKPVMRSKPHPTKIVIENAGKEAIFLNTTCSGLWASLEQDGQNLEIDPYCKTSCDTPHIGGCPAICLEADRLLVPGERETFEWDGVVLEKSASCYAPSHPVTSTVLTARVCWHSPLASSGGQSACASTSFPYADVAGVVVRAEPSEMPARKSRLVLRNTQDHPIEINRESCGAQAVFGLESSDTYLYAFCNVCECSAAPNRGCGPPPACGTCAPPVMELLQPGATFEFAWDQQLWYTPVKICSVRHTLQPGDAVGMRACWREPGSGDTKCSSRRVNWSDDIVTFEP